MDVKSPLMRLLYVPAGERPVVLRARSAAREGAAAPAVLRKSGSLHLGYRPSHEFFCQQNVRAQSRREPKSPPHRGPYCSSEARLAPVTGFRQRGTSTIVYQGTARAQPLAIFRAAVNSSMAASLTDHAHTKR